ncbi:MAG: GDSL-type esterase/lipase family protein [Pseudomonadota bacterium]
MRRVATAGLAAALGLLGAIGPAPQARAADPMLSELPCPAGPVRIAVVGDSLADGMWGSFFRAFARCALVETPRVTAVSDGLAKTAPDDWLDRYDAAMPAVAGPAPVDIAVVQIGANDVTGIRIGARRASFGAEGWDELYAERASALAAGLRERAREVFWIGLPVVGKARLEPDYAVLSALQAKAVEAGGAVFLDIHALTRFGAEGFVMNAAVDGGRVRQLRAPDQVHFTELGYDLVARRMADRLRELFKESRRDKAVGGVALQ